jgi:hypothetical protein
VEVAYPVIQELIEIKKKSGKVMPKLDPIIDPNVMLATIVKPYIEQVQLIDDSKVPDVKADSFKVVNLTLIREWISLL